MRLQNYLITEGERTRTITEDEAMNKLETNHRVAAVSFQDRDKRIYRGLSKSHGEFAFVQPSQYNRKSANTLNAYTLLLDNLPEWKQYPKRSKSIIATTEYSRATDYGYGGSVYCVFPENNSKIGVCPSRDIWDSFKFSMGAPNMSTFNYSLLSLIMLAYNTKDMSIEDFKDFDSFLEKLDYVDKYRFEIHDDYLLPGIIEDLKLQDYFKKGSKIRLIVHLGKLLNPVKNKFELVKVGDSLQPYREVWTDGDCVLVEKSYFMDKLLGKFR